MSWILLSFSSAILLGAYEIFKKLALRSFPIWPVLFWSAVLNGLLLLPEAFLSAPSVPVTVHGWILLKALVVAASWGCSFTALKHLPISILTPMRAFSPVFTALGGVFLLGETLLTRQWLGILGCSLGFLSLAKVSRQENILFHRNRWVAIYLISLLFGIVASLLDKTIMTLPEIPGSSLQRAVILQIWFSVYTPLSLLPFYLYSRRSAPASAFLPWSWAIPAISLSLLAADRCYFTALGHPDAFISIVSSLRQTCILVAAIAGGALFGESHLAEKAKSILIILIGVFLLLYK